MLIIARYIISILYAALMLVAVVFAFRQSKRIDFIMALGALVLIIANFSAHTQSIVTAIISLLLIHAAALMNGKKNGKMNPLHHVIRLAVSVGIVMLFWFS